MTNIDEQLLNANQQREAAQELKSQRSGVSNEAEGASGSGSLRERAMQARQALNIKEQAKKKIEEKVAAPAKMATNNLLRWAWMTLIPSFGLSLIYINIHVFLRMVLGEKLFCKLGEEWIPKQISAVGGDAGKMAGKSIGVVEVMGLLFLDLLVFFLIFMILSIVVMITTWLGASWWGKLGMIYNALKALGWATISALVSLFS